MHFGVEARASAESTILKLPSAKLNGLALLGGHDFSRAVEAQKSGALAPAVPLRAP